jgi:anti-anti-sigma regulatory factor
MLRVSVIPQADAITIKLEGKLLGDWCAEVAGAFDHVAADLGAAAIRLDLYDVIFVDAAGTELIRSLIARGAKVIRSSSYVAELLKPERV